MMHSTIKKKNSLIPALIFLGLLTACAVNIVFVINGLDTLQDFGSFYASGQLANEGKNPYSTESPFMFSVNFNQISLKGDAPNLNPPFSVLIFQGLALADPFTAANIWRGLSVLLFSLSLYLLVKTSRVTGLRAAMITVWAISMAAFWHTLQLGQVYCLLLLLTVWAWIALKKDRQIQAGIALGLLIAFKPNFIVWAVLLLAARYWKTFLTAGFTALGVSLIPLPFKGWEIYRQWLEASSTYTPALLLFPGNNSLQGLTARILHPEIGLALSVVLTVALIWHVFSRRPAVTDVNSLGIIVSLLVSPIAWTGYTLLTLPEFFESPKWHWLYKVSAVIFAVPVIFILVFFEKSYAGFILFGWFYGWGLLTLLSALIFKSGMFAGKKADRISSIQTN
jgi:hypothetical protein